jgi:hypothetical protein
VAGNPSPPAPTREEILRFLARHYHPTNKIPGLMAELDFATMLEGMGYGDRLVRGGWIVEPESPEFYSKRVALFPAPFGAASTEPPIPVVTTAQYLRGAGMRTLYCVPLAVAGTSVTWGAAEMSGPTVGSPHPLVEEFSQFPHRQRGYSKRTADADVSPLGAVAARELEVLFARESMLDAIRSDRLVVANDLDYLVWGKKSTYPLEIKEKTSADGGKIGRFFGLDIGPFSKLACFEASGSGHDSLFVVREIEDRESRRLKAWHMIRFGDLCRSCSWVYQGGGRNMLGGASAVVKIPLGAFRPLDRTSLADL